MHLIYVVVMDVKCWDINKDEHLKGLLVIRKADVTNANFGCFVSVQHPIVCCAEEVQLVFEYHKENNDVVLLLMMQSTTIWTGELVMFDKKQFWILIIILYIKLSIDYHQGESLIQLNQIKSITLTIKSIKLNHNSQGVDVDAKSSMLQSPSHKLNSHQTLSEHVNDRTSQI